MLLRAIPVVFAAIYFAPTVAGVASSARRIPGLRSRSLPTIPSACQAGCAPFAPFLAGAACPVTQCCSSLFETGYANCFRCIGESIHATDFSIAQEYVDVLTTSCVAEGFPLAVLTLPGQDANRTLTTALPADASAIPVFPPASGSVVRSSTAPAHSRSAVTGTATASHSRGPQISGSAPGSSTASGASKTASASAVFSSPPANSSSATAPPSLTTVFASSGAPAPSPSAPNAAPRSAGLDTVAVVVVLALQVLFV
ncbi:hypothetical protein B0H15DRAFT_950179 [Mycena belliarum]|uniref:Extracellular membrane protein CFEM domain-containing protein n=1 Tax=Mycena belliarum TaxID=1033014 RepID=A0AAD6XNK8_9AGAR|nr:hypothetical protein B0H15DRAFT_950179 [Mycena belliae]